MVQVLLMIPLRCLSQLSSLHRMRDREGWFAKDASALPAATAPLSPVAIDPCAGDHELPVVIQQQHADITADGAPESEASSSCPPAAVSVGSIFMALGSEEISSVLHVTVERDVHVLSGCFVVSSDSCVAYEQLASLAAVDDDNVSAAAAVADAAADAAAHDISGAPIASDVTCDRVNAAVSLVEHDGLPQPHDEQLQQQPSESTVPASASEPMALALAESDVLVPNHSTAAAAVDLSPRISAATAPFPTCIAESEAPVVKPALSLRQRMTMYGLCLLVASATSRPFVLTFLPRTCVAGFRAITI